MIHLRKSIFLLLPALTVFLFGCHKNNNTPTVAPTDTTAPFIYGVLIAQKTIDISNDTSEYDAEAYFFNDSINKQYVYVGTVSLNGDSLGYLSYYLYYYLPNFEDSVNWNISASSYNPQIIYDVKNNFPSYKDTIPDTVLALNGLSFDFTAANTNNADSAEVFIEEADIKKFCSANAEIVTFSASEISTAFQVSGNLPIPNTLTFDIAVYNPVIKVYEGKRYKFVNIAYISKKIYFY